MMLPSKFTTMPSPMESNEPSEPHMHVGRHHQVLESVSLICEAPAFANRRGVAGGADHDFGALVGAFARHLGEHAVLANDQRDFCALRSFDDGNADIVGLPGLDRNPRMEFPVIELDLAAIVDDEARIVRVAVGVNSMMEKQTQIVVDAGLLERCDFRPIEPAHDLGIGVHRQAVQRVFRKYHEASPASATSRLRGKHIACELLRSSARCTYGTSRSMNKQMHVTKLAHRE